MNLVKNVTKDIQDLSGVWEELPVVLGLVLIVLISILIFVDKPVFTLVAQPTNIILIATVIAAVAKIVT
jgi:hypothetical protein